MPLMTRNPIQSSRVRKSKFIYYKEKKPGEIENILALAKERKQLPTSLSGMFDSKLFLDSIENAVKLAKKSASKSAIFFLKRNDGKVIPLKLSIQKSGRILILPQPVTHGLGHSNEVEQFEVLKNILRNGFSSNLGSKLYGVNEIDKSHMKNNYTNTVIEKDKRGIALARGSVSRNQLLSGDSYAILFLTSVENITQREEKTYAFVEKAKPSQILSINIKIDPNASKELVERKKAFYRAELKGWPIKFV